MVERVEMLSTGNQLRAARALVGMTQIDLAEAAGRNPNTIRDMEARGSQGFSSSYETVLAVQKALEAAGVEFLNHGLPGVRLKPR